MRRLMLVTALCFTATGIAGLAQAEEPKDAAARLFREGSDAYARKDFREAAADFESAYHTIPRGAAVYNAGLAWEGADELARAADDYAAAVGSSDASPAQRSDAASKLKALEARVGRLVVTGPADARVTLDDGADAGLPLAVHLSPGHHTLAIAYTGGVTRTRGLEARAGEEQVVRLEEPSAATAEEPKEDRHEPKHGQSSAADDGAATRRTLAWVAAGGAVVASGLAFAFYETGLSALNKYEGTKDMDGSSGAQATNDKTAEQVSWGVAGALAVTAVVLYLTSSGSPSTSATTSLQVGPTGAQLHLSF
jgi:tetratricopeptide (TPR) repeat protein